MGTSQGIVPTQGQTPELLPENKEVLTPKEIELQEYLDSARKAEGQFGKDAQIEATEAFETRYEEDRKKAAESASLSDSLARQEDETINRVWSMVASRLLPIGAEDGDVVTKQGGKIIWSNLAALFFKIPTGATSELYLALKHKDCPSLVTDDAAVIVLDENGDPLWYIQFDYLRGVATPTS